MVMVIFTPEVELMLFLLMHTLKRQNTGKTHADRRNVSPLIRNEVAGASRGVWFLCMRSERIW